jgi:polyhydroxyalkanoate synthesis regulator phasin
MRRVNFDYGNTCPEIDAAIREAKGEIEAFMSDLLSDACGLLEKKRLQELAQIYADDLYAKIEPAFEKARSSNEKMRDAADDQISDLKDEVNNLEHQVKDLESRAEA